MSPTHAEPDTTTPRANTMKECNSLALGGLQIASTAAWPAALAFSSKEKDGVDGDGGDDGDVDSHGDGFGDGLCRLGRWSWR